MDRLTRENVIVQLVERDIDQMDWGTIGCVMREGCIGYDNMNDREIIEYFLCYIRIPNDEDEAFEYVTQGGEVLKVQPVDDAGISIDGVVDDYQYI